MYEPKSEQEIKLLPSESGKFYYYARQKIAELKRVPDLAKKKQKKLKIKNNTLQARIRESKDRQRENSFSEKDVTDSVKQTESDTSVEKDTEVTHRQREREGRQTARDISGEEDRENAVDKESKGTSDTENKEDKESKDEEDEVDEEQVEDSEDEKSTEEEQDGDSVRNKESDAESRESERINDKENTDDQTNSTNKSDESESEKFKEKFNENVLTINLDNFNDSSVKDSLYTSTEVDPLLDN